jgi:hypothetical protein
MQYQQDKFGRGVIVVPDEVARMLSSHQDEGWREVAGVGWGSGRHFPVDHEVTVAARQIEALRDTHRDTHAMVVGSGDWDYTARYWVDYVAHRDLHPRYFDVDPETGTARFCG